MIEILLKNISSPAILFFFTGIFSGLVKSDLKIPEQVSKFIGLYLMMAIGYKGGYAISQQVITLKMIYLTIATIAIAFLQPFLCFFFLQATTLDKKTKAAISSHYSSISMATFLTAISFLKLKSIPYQGYIIAIASIMDAPAIISGLYLSTEKHEIKIKPLLRKIFSNGSMLLLLFSIIIGFIGSQSGMNQMKGLLDTPFTGFLAFFLLDKGITVALQREEFKNFDIRVFLFGILMPIFGAIIGIVTSKVIGLDFGTAFLFTVLTSSASYIVVTSILKDLLPDAKIEIYLTLSLGVTFPFNITLGMPLYFWALKLIL